MGEGIGGSRIGEIVGGNVDSLNRGDRSFLCRRDALLKNTHLGGQCRLVSYSARRAAKKSGNLGSGLGESEDVVDEEQHVLMLLIAEVFRHRESSESDSETGSGRLVHLAVDESHLGTLVQKDESALIIEDRVTLFIALHGDQAGLDHFTVKIIPLTRALADTGKE